MRARIAVTATYRLPTHAIGDERSCTQRSDDTVRGRDPHRARAAHRRAFPACARRARPPRARPPAARALPASRCRRRIRRRVRVRGGAPRSHRRGRAARAWPPHVRVTPVRRLLRRRRRARAAPRRSPRVRGGRRRHRARAHAPPRDRLPVARGARAFARTRPGHSTRSMGPQLQRRLALEYAVLPHRRRLAFRAPRRRGRRIPRSRSSVCAAVACPAHTDRTTGRVLAVERRAGVGGAPRSRRPVRSSSGSSTRRRSPRPRASTLDGAPAPGRSSTSPAASLRTSPAPSCSVPGRSRRSASRVR